MNDHEISSDEMDESVPLAVREELSLKRTKAHLQTKVDALREERNTKKEVVRTIKKKLARDTKEYEAMVWARLDMQRDIETLKERCTILAANQQQLEESTKATDGLQRTLGKLKASLDRIVRSREEVRNKKDELYRSVIERGCGVLEQAENTSQFLNSRRRDASVVSAKVNSKVDSVDMLMQLYDEYETLNQGLNSEHIHNSALDKLVHIQLQQARYRLDIGIQSRIELEHEFDNSCEISQQTCDTLKQIVVHAKEIINVDGTANSLLLKKTSTIMGLAQDSYQKLNDQQSYSVETSCRFNNLEELEQQIQNEIEEFKRLECQQNDISVRQKNIEIDLHRTKQLRLRWNADNVPDEFKNSVTPRPSSRISTPRNTPR